MLGVQYLQDWCSFTWLNSCWMAADESWSQGHGRQITVLQFASVRAKLQSHIVFAKCVSWNLDSLPHLPHIYGTFIIQIKENSTGKTLATSNFYCDDKTRRQSLFHCSETAKSYDCFNTNYICKASCYSKDIYIVRFLRKVKHLSEDNVYKCRTIQSLDCSSLSQGGRRD